jgi:hypothetical protein
MPPHRQISQITRQSEHENLAAPPPPDERPGTIPLSLSRITYRDLNARQKENYNFYKLAAVLAEYGFVSLRLCDDWQGADLIAQHIDGETFLKVQLKSRLTFKAKYRGKQLFIAFPEGEEWYLYPHDELLDRIFTDTDIIEDTVSWRDRGGYSIGKLSSEMRNLLECYKIGRAQAPPLMVEAEKGD